MDILEELTQTHLKHSTMIDVIMLEYLSREKKSGERALLSLGYNHGSNDSDGGRPLRFHVPTKIVHFLGVEYSDSLRTKVSLRPRYKIRTMLPLVQSRSNRVVDRVENSNLSLVTEVAL